MAEIRPDLFHEYALRGSIEPATMKLLGRALAQYFQALPSDEELIVARDQSGVVESYRDLLVEELLRAGLKVADLGEVPSPLFYFVPYQLD